MLRPIILGGRTVAMTSIYRKPAADARPKRPGCSSFGKRGRTHRCQGAGKPWRSCRASSVGKHSMTSEYHAGCDRRSFTSISTVMSHPISPILLSECCLNDAPVCRRVCKLRYGDSKGAHRRPGDGGVWAKDSWLDRRQGTSCRI